MTDYIPYLNKTSISVGDVDTLVIRSAEPNSILYADSEQEVKSLKLNTGELIVGTADAPTTGILTGTPNQVIVNNLNLSLPQDVDMKAAPTFKGITLNNGDINWTTVATDTALTISRSLGLGMLPVLELAGNVIRGNSASDLGDTGNKFRDLHIARNIHVDGKVDGRDVSADGATLDAIVATIGDFVTKSTTQTITGTKTFTAPIITSSTVDGRDIAFDGAKLDGIAVDLTAVKANYVTTNTVQTITAAKMFDYPIHFTIPSTSRKKIDLYASSTAGSEHAFYGMALDGNTTVIQCPSASQNIAFKVGDTTTSKEIFEVRGDRGSIRPGADASTLSLGSSGRKFHNLYLSGNITVDGLVDGRDVAADGKTLDDLITGGFVTLNTAQTITGKKTFQNTELEFKTETKNIFRMQSTAPTGTGGTTIHMVGNSHFGNGLYIESDGSDIASFMNANDFEFYGATDAKHIVTFKSDLTSIHPGLAATTDLGTEALPFKHLILGKGTGTIQMGHNVRGDGRAALALFSNGNQPSDIYFGQDARTDANTMWSQGSRSKGGDDKYDFQYYRGPKNTGAGFVEFLTFKGDGTAINPRASGVTSLGESGKRFTNVYSNIVLSNSNATLDTNYKDELKLTVSGGWGGGAQAATGLAVRVGNIITISFLAFNYAAASPASLTINGIPSKYYPALGGGVDPIVEPKRVKNGSVVDGTAYIHKGSIVLRVGINSDFGGGAAAVGFPPFTVTYVADVF